MKTLIQLILAGVIGGAIAFGAFKAFDKDTVIYEQLSAPSVVHQVSAPVPMDYSNDFVIAAEQANPAVVHIIAKNKEYVAYSNGQQQQRQPYGDFWGYRRQRGNRPQAGTGSGVLISEDGTIVTNNHVVGFADIIEVVTQDGTTYMATKVGTDASADIAVIKIEGLGLPHLKFADSDDVKVGQWVVAVGNPFNLTSTVTAGIVSAKGRDLDIIQGQKAIEEFIQTDAVVNPGNSGGALVNTKGELIGINTAISSPTGVYAGYSFAIPSNLVKRVINDINEVGGDVQRAMLGIAIRDVTEELKAELQKDGFDIWSSSGIIVTNFLGRQFSSAKHSGVEIGDVIVGINQKPVYNSDELRDALKFVKVGDTIDVLVNRGKNQKSIPVKLRRGI